MSRKTRSSESIHLRVLGYREDADWVAHCLETDLIGTGRTFDAALKELQEATAAQLGFARFKRQPSLFSHPAPPHIFESYNRLLAERLERLDETARDSSRTISAFSLPAARKGSFDLACEGL